MSWKQAMKSRRFETFEDPVTNFHIDKVEYDALYGRACIELFDGEEWRVETFFQENPLVQGCWLFTDEDSRCDLYDIALEMGLVLQLKEIQEGEQDTDRRVRKELEKQASQTTQVRLHVTKLHAEPAKALVFANTYEDKTKRYDYVNSQLQLSQISSKQRKRMERELRGLKAALTSSI